MTDLLKSRRPRVAVTHDAGYNIEDYLRAVERAGGEGVAVTPGSDVSMQDFDALLISGGVDVNPALYGQEPAPETERSDDDRDRLEKELLREALDDRKPVLAICRGMQLFNVALGGTLQQHIEKHRQPPGQPPGDKSIPSHTVRIEDTSRLSALIGATVTPVNSRHHQAVGSVAPGLIVTANAEDGTIEGLEIPGSEFVVAVQWHPENMASRDASQQRLFDGFIEAARAAER